ncbi:hypothetical protein BDF21DRAFT_62875 [Thamnidium elegans]|nr:hypothetical protein BDF21DRAFT_62875 [Thamnidium elegans]
MTKYDQLVSETLEQKNKVSYLYQQTTNLSTQLASSQLSIQHATKIKNEVSRGTETVCEIEKKILHQIKRVKKKDSLYLELNGPPSPPRSMDSTTIRYSTIQSKNKLMDLVKTLYFHQAFIEQAEVSVRQEKKDSITSFIHCMQSISQVEESVTKIYPKLAELEKEIKLLRRDIEKGNGTTARRVIVGYGILLIELWRRDKYTESREMQIYCRLYLVNLDN